MFCDVRKLPDGQPVCIGGYGHTLLPEECRYDNARFIWEILSPSGRATLFQEVGQPGMGKEELTQRAVAKFIEATGIETRYIFPGPLDELGSMAARMAIRDSGLDEQGIGAIVFASNTRPYGYPSHADLTKKRLGLDNDALCFDVQEACP
ncbi:MAG TPA: hypothetical protein VMS93_07905, partial [Candidatus Saccharimonadales bacterium]|nr:hypothetical protein [Candidatus Saccharimonadales bacterium]